MNGSTQQPIHQQEQRDDLRARVALACAGYNLSPTVSAAVHTQGPQATVRGLPLPAEVFQQADEVVAFSAQHGLTILTPMSGFWPWADPRLASPPPLVLWASGQLENLQEPLIQLGEQTGVSVSSVDDWSVLDVATHLSDSGYVLVSAADTRVGQLVRRAAVALGGRWVTVSTDLLRDTALAPLSDQRGLIVTATPPLHAPHRASREDAADVVSRLATVTIRPSSGSGCTASSSGIAPKLRALR